MLLFSMASKTFLPKWNGRPQSKLLGFDPAMLLKTKLFALLNRVSALATLKLTEVDPEPTVLMLVALRFWLDEGQYQPIAEVQPGIPVVVLSRKKMPFDPVSTKLLE